MIVNVYVQPWWILLLIMPLLTVLYGILCRYCGRYFRGLSIISFVAWFAVMLCYLLLMRSSGTRKSIQPLFESYLHIADNNEVFRSNFTNILLFFPGGMLLPSCLPVRMRYSLQLCLTVVILFLISSAAELLQYVYALGVPEADDIFHNTLGAFLGAGAARLASHWAATLRK